MTILDMDPTRARAALLGALARGDTVWLIRRGSTARGNLIVDVLVEKNPPEFEAMGAAVAALVGRPYLYRHYGVLVQGNYPGAAEAMIAVLSVVLFGAPDQLVAVWL